MNTEAYFGMILNILIGLTLIVLVLAFLYLIYGEREGGVPSPKVEFVKNLSKSLPSKMVQFFTLC